MDVACLCLPFLLSCTVMYQHYSAVLLTMITTILASILWQYKQSLNFRQHSTSKKRIDVNNLNIDCQLRFISYYRIAINICTAVAILAVDFKVFPRALAKTETYGHGLMDIGVGCFVIATAIVAPEARYSLPSSDKRSKTTNNKGERRLFYFYLIYILKAFIKLF